MIHSTTFSILMIRGIEVIQPAAAGLMAGRIDVNTFQRRQIPQVPTACQSTCDPVNTTLASGNCPPSQCCLPTFETSYFSCYSCVASSENITDYTAVQGVLDDLYDECASLGYQLPVLTFPGQNPNRALSSVVQSRTSTQTTISATTVSTATFTPLTSRETVTSLAASSTSPSQTTSSTSPFKTPSSGIRSGETSRFELIAGVMMVLFFFSGVV